MTGAFQANAFQNNAFQTGGRFVPIIPTSYQTDRQDLNDALEALIDAFIQSTNYGVVRKFWSQMPASLTGEGPMVVLGDITEAVKHDESLRITVYTGSIWYIDWLTDPAEYNTRVNTFADMMRDLFTANPTISPRGLLEEVGFQEGEIRQGTLVFGAPQLLFRWNVLEGRN